MSQDIDPQAPEAQDLMSSDSIGFSDNSKSLVDPFANDFPSVFFNGADRKVLLDEVVHLCQFGNNLVAVLGENGVGKSTFLNQAKLDLAETAFCCFVTGSVSMTAEDVFTQVIAQLELPVTTSTSAGEMLAKLRHAMSEGFLHRVVIIVDNAHLLDDQILSALLSLLQGHQGNHLHILMSGNHDLVQRLDQFEMVDVLVYDITLNPLSLDEVREYLNFKLIAAGYQQANQFDNAQIKLIWSQSRGNPKLINQLAQGFLFQKEHGDASLGDESYKVEEQETKELQDEKLFSESLQREGFEGDSFERDGFEGDGFEGDGFEENGYPVDEELAEGEVESNSGGLPILHMSLLVVLLAALIMALFYMGGDDEVSSADSNNLIKQPTLNNDGLSQTNSTDNESEKINSAAGQEPTSIIDAKPEQPLKENNLTSINKNNSQSDTSSSLGVTEKINKGSLEANADKNIEVNIDGGREGTVVQGAVNQGAVIQGSMESGDQGQIVDLNNQSSSPEATKGNAVSINQQTPSETASPAVNQSQPPEPGLSKAPSSSLNVAPSLKEELEKEVRALESTGAVSRLSADEQEILSWSDTGYTLQVIAASQIQSIDKFLSDQPNKNDLKLVAVSRNGSPWYVIVTGQFPDAAQARGAIQRLPQAQVNTGPWPRKISDLKQEIEAFRSN